MTHRWLVLHLEAPLMAFGGVAVDHLRPTRDFPAASMITGLIANALGWDWCEGERHQRLQDRLLFAACIEREGFPLIDVQNVALRYNESGWTTRAAPEERTGAARTYASPHRRRRVFRADSMVDLVLRLVRADTHPTTQKVADALNSPVRPLFLGRKPCLPSLPLVPPPPDCWVEADTAHAALCAVAERQRPNVRKRALWPLGEGPDQGADVDGLEERADLRNWISGVHCGARRVVEGWVP